MLDEKSVSETIRKPPLVKDQTTLRKQKKIWQKNDFQYGGIGILTPYNVVRLLKARL